VNCAQSSGREIIDGGLRVSDFTFPAFCAALGREVGDPLDRARPLATDVEDIQQAQYLYEYLYRQFQARTIVVEPRYVDRDYLAEYTSFYATAFTPFDRFCKRVHFFTHAFDRETFARFVVEHGQHNDFATFCNSYLGFVVVRPLPQAIIGRTVVRSYPSEDKRHYRAVGDEKVNLFGIDLTVTDTLPFEQQDSVVAACATVALWSAFHQTARLFGTSSPRPAEITRQATANLYQERAFPSQGLTVEQTCDAIRTNGLEPEVLRLDKGIHVPILSWIRAYVAMGIPVLLGMRIPRDGSAAEPLSDDMRRERAEAVAPSWHAPQSEAGDADESDFVLHAVTVVGYKLSEAPAHARETDPNLYEAPSVGRRVTRLYCHDDNLGPFARFAVQSAPEGGRLRLLRSDYVCAGVPAEIEFENIIAPVYPKIRLSYPEVQRWVTLLDKVLRGLLHPNAYESREWDVRLVENRCARADIFDLPLPKEKRLELLVAPQPRYMWLASLTAGDVEVVRFYADATSIGRSVPIRIAIFATDELKRNVIEVLGELKDHRGASALAQHLSGFGDSCLLTD
jgi:hypothetical protein